MQYLKVLKIRIDSGAPSLRTNKFNTRKTSANKWSTMAGSFPMLYIAGDKIKLPELNTTQIFESFHVISQKSIYNVTMCQDLLRELGINLNFQNNFVGFKDTKIPLKPDNCEMRTDFAIQESENIRNVTNRIKKILGAKYKKANLKNRTHKLKYLNSDEQVLIYRLLKKHENMFDDALKNYTDTE